MQSTHICPLILLADSLADFGEFSQIRHRGEESELLRVQILAEERVAQGSNFDALESSGLQSPGRDVESLRAAGGPTAVRQLGFLAFVVGIDERRRTLFFSPPQHHRVLSCHRAHSKLSTPALLLVAGCRSGGLKK